MGFNKLEVVNRQLHGFHAHSIKFNPGSDQAFAVVGGANFGISGCGEAQICTVAQIPPNQKYIWPDSFFDICWNPFDPSQILTATGDGYVLLWSSQSAQPVQMLPAHNREVHSIDVTRNSGTLLLATGSWDSTVKVFDFSKQQLLTILSGHTSLLYEVKWNPLKPNLVASVAGDGLLCIDDVGMKHGSIVKLKAHMSETLCCDWSQQNDNFLVTGASDAIIRLWDFRNMNSPLLQLAHHSNAVKNVKFCPHNCQQLGSTSYDFTTRVFDLSTTPGKMITTQSHSEFVYGLDWSPLQSNVLIDASWDKTSVLYRLEISS